MSQKSNKWRPKNSMDAHVVVAYRVNQCAPRRMLEKDANTHVQTFLCSKRENGGIRCCQRFAVPGIRYASLKVPLRQKMSGHKSWSSILKECVPRPLPG